MSNQISNERLAEMAAWEPSAKHSVLSAQREEWQSMARELLEAREKLAMLSDPAKVHTNILRGTIALTKAQAIHIAGLPADVEEQLQQLRASHEELVKALEKIHQHPGNKSRCECEDHSSPDCCSQADRDFFCPDCIAGAALESARKVNG